MKERTQDFSVSIEPWRSGVPARGAAHCCASDAALAAEALHVQQRQQAAVERARVEAQDRFKLGDAPVTDTHEAAARAEAMRAEVLAAQTALQLKRSALADAEVGDCARDGRPADGDGAGDAGLLCHER